MTGGIGSPRPAAEESVQAERRRLRVALDAAAGQVGRCSSNPATVGQLPWQRLQCVAASSVQRAVQPAQLAVTGTCLNRPG
jgi:hypothetical protein